MSKRRTIMELSVIHVAADVLVDALEAMDDSGRIFAKDYGSFMTTIRLMQKECVNHGRAIVDLVNHVHHLVEEAYRKGHYYEMRKNKE